MVETKKLGGRIEISLPALNGYNGGRVFGEIIAINVAIYSPDSQFHGNIPKRGPITITYGQQRLVLSDCTPRRIAITSLPSSGSPFRLVNSSITFTQKIAAL